MPKPKTVKPIKAKISKVKRKTPRGGKGKKKVKTIGKVKRIGEINQKVMQRPNQAPVKQQLEMVY